MKAKNLYIIAGCNGAGKTTASYTILPEILKCKEFVNADEIAKGLSPFQPQKVAFEAGRIMLERIEYLFSAGESFAFETTLSTKSYKSKIVWAKQNGYTIKLLFFWLPSIEMAVNRVKVRVKEGGHNIPKEVISRRYIRGLENLFKIYLPLCDDWVVFDNSTTVSQIIAEGQSDMTNTIHQPEKWLSLKKNFC
ncbi:zeta toxin [Flavobacterium silvisoli]|uniref:Zeta toxin n=1 Tax=Flavobacterium silvisoli TaxID=2529433 RepID=A0A4Q9YR04_9FLAO|nr:zeta toxin family protein [Flavobacterium silvisoli]TBX65967.1 zeta toxin [Flavobacterium silvisoli]